ncbi:hypothetical protein MO867_02285 [Microbulbifer sp. OS29]|uniref:Uncharacterized protein n=1 Tax=Microbulbifer okhotskensis TaxID=2926617 RepID=A0A9X2EKA2_9GAMM|nr:hypothetical protein [Microbulbifer okhotskensis]MCO1333160.1 hypothetical protein [Microbulbifer okhotskensis]
MADWQADLVDRMSNIQFTEQYFPILHNGLLQDQDVMVHSLGCSVWNTLGHELELMAVVECPAPSSHGADIRSDSGWFVMGESRPSCLVEFERYDGTEKGQLKLEEKLRNLLEAAQRWEHSPKILVLSAWRQGIVRAVDTERLKSICRCGFTSNTGARISASSITKIVFSEFLFEKSASELCLTLNRLRCERLL